MISIISYLQSQEKRQKELKIEGYKDMMVTACPVKEELKLKNIMDRL